jgi:hypothetical protein
MSSNMTLAGLSSTACPSRPDRGSIPRMIARIAHLAVMGGGQVDDSVGQLLESPTSSAMTPS